MQVHASQFGSRLTCNSRVILHIKARIRARAGESACRFARVMGGGDERCSCESEVVRERATKRTITYRLASEALWARTAKNTD